MVKLSIIVPVPKVNDNLGRLFRSTNEYLRRGAELRVVLGIEADYDEVLNIMTSECKHLTRCYLASEMSMLTEVLVERGIRSCNGEYVTIINPDGKLLSTKVYKLFTRLSSDQADIFQLNLRLHRADNTLITSNPINSDKEYIGFSALRNEVLNLDWNSKIFRTDFLKEYAMRGIVTPGVDEPEILKLVGVHTTTVRLNINFYEMKVGLNISSIQKVDRLIKVTDEVVSGCEESLVFSLEPTINQLLKYKCKLTKLRDELISSMGVIKRLKYKFNRYRNGD